MIDKVLIKPKNPQSQTKDRIVSASLGSTREKMGIEITKTAWISVAFSI